MVSEANLCIDHSIILGRKVVGINGETLLQTVSNHLELSQIPILLPLEPDNNSLPETALPSKVQDCPPHYITGEHGLGSRCGVIQAGSWIRAKDLI